MGLAEHVVGRRIDRVTVHHPRSVRRHLAGSGRLRRSARRRRPSSVQSDGASTCGCRSRGRRHPRPSRHERADAHRRARRRGPASPAHLLRPRERHPAALRRPAHLRRHVHQRRGSRAAGGDRPHRPRPAGSAVRPVRLPGSAAAARDRRQARPARPDAHLRRRQHLCRRGPVAYARCTTPATPVTCARARSTTCWHHIVRGDARGAGPGRHLVRRALRQRQRPERLLRALARGLRTGRPAVPALRRPRSGASRS